MNSLVWNRDIVTGVACYFIGAMLRIGFVRKTWNEGFE